MFLFVYLYFFRSKEPTLSEFIGHIDLFNFFVVVLAALLAYFNTNAANNNCVNENHEESKLLWISKGIFAVFIMYQLFFQGGLYRFYSRLTTRVGQVQTHLFRRERKSSRIDHENYSVPAIHKFLDNWMLPLIINVALWTQTEYQSLNTPRTAIIGILPSFTRVFSIMFLVSNACKLFTGKVGSNLTPNYISHSGVTSFSHFWSTLWVPELLCLILFLLYLLFVIYYLITNEKLHSLSPEFLNLFKLAIDFVGLKCLMDTVSLIQVNESNILLRSNLIFNSKHVGDSISNLNSNSNGGRKQNDDEDSVNDETSANTTTTVSNNTRLTLSSRFQEHLQRHTLTHGVDNMHMGGVQQYFYLTRFIDFIKMVMCVEFLNCTLHVINVFKWIFPDYHASPIGQSVIYIMGAVTPLLYNFIFKLYRNQPGCAVESARYYTVFSLFFCVVLSCALIGAFAACYTLTQFATDDTIDANNAHNIISLFVYIAKSNAIPTTFAFGLVFLTSPGASRCSSKWHSLPFIARVLLAPMPWLSPYLIQRLHIASGTVLFTSGLYHGISWCVVFLAPHTFLNSISTTFIVAIITGVLMLFALIKLLWPPGMDMYGSHLSTYLNLLSKYLKDSKYGMWHIYLANIVFILFCLHASFDYTLGQLALFYWTFPVIGFIILIFLHPAKLNYYAAIIFRNLNVQIQSTTNYDRNYVILNKTQQSVIKERKLFHIQLDVQLPTYDSHFIDVFREQSYTGSCDVIMVKLKPKDIVNTEKGNVNKRGLMYFPREIETVHYYSVVGISVSETGPRHASNYPHTFHNNGGRVTVDLMIGRTDRKDGSSSTLIGDNEGSYDLDVVGFVKSNTQESVTAPAVLAFGWESGAAAFCSLFKRRGESVTHCSGDMSYRDSFSGSDINSDRLMLTQLHQRKTSVVKGSSTANILLAASSSPRSKVNSNKAVNSSSGGSSRKNRSSLEERLLDTSHGDPDNGEIQLSVHSRDNSVLSRESVGVISSVVRGNLVPITSGSLAAPPSSQLSSVSISNVGGGPQQPHPITYLSSTDILQPPSTEQTTPVTDLMVIWSAFNYKTSAKNASNDEISRHIARAVVDLAKYQKFLYDHSTTEGSTAKILFLVTGMPVLFMCADANREAAVGTTAREAQLEEIEQKVADICEELVSGGLSSEISRNNQNAQIIEDGGLVIAKSSLRQFIANILQDRKSVNNWISLQTMMLSESEEDAQAKLNFRIRQALKTLFRSSTSGNTSSYTSSISAVSNMQARNVLSMFVPEVIQDKYGFGSTLKYEMYDNVNSSLIRHHVDYLKNNKRFLGNLYHDQAFLSSLAQQRQANNHTFMSHNFIYDNGMQTGMQTADTNTPMNGDTFSGNNHNDNDNDTYITQEDESESLVSCHILFSADYASGKQDQLKAVVDLISYEQKKSKTPASLTFVPDG